MVKKEATPPAESKTSKYVLFGLGYIASALIGVLVGALIMILLVSLTSGLSPADLLSGAIKTGPSQKITIKSKTQEMEAVTAVVKKLQPSVVNVRTTQVLTDLFHEGEEAKGVGSGVIFREDGYILTNNHVVEGAKEIFVTIGNEDVAGEVVGGDKETDIAVVKIPRKGLPAAELGSSGSLQVGEMVVALGSPFGFEHTVTSGIISALHRNITTEDQPPQSYTNLIQTDAPINPGNSGGALADAEGKVVGINTLIYSPSGASAGIGFAIPIETAKDVAEQLITKGEVSHPYMGILGQTVDRDLAEQMNLSVKEGAIIQEVSSGSPADKAGLKRGDIVVKFDGTRIKTMDDLIGAIRSKQVGDKVTIEYVHGTAKRETTLTLAEKPR